MFELTTNRKIVEIRESGEIIDLVNFNTKESIEEMGFIAVESAVRDKIVLSINISEYETPLYFLTPDQIERYNIKFPFHILQILAPKFMP